MYNKFNTGDRLRDLREKNGIGRTDLAREFQISYSTLTNIELGRTLPTLDILDNYCSKFDTSADDILYGKGYSNYNLFKKIRHLSATQQEVICAVISLFR